MVYESLFSLESSTSYPFDHMPFKGTTRGALDLVSNCVKSSDSFRRKIIFGAPRMIRAVIDCKVDGELEGDCVEVVNSATDIALRMYSDVDYYKKGIEDYVNMLSSTGNSFILDREMVQEDDRTTWRCSSGSKSSRSAAYLSKALDGKDIFLMVLAHGGIMAGMDVFLKYQDAVSSSNSAIYPVRFSAHKKNDDIPCLDDREIDYLHDMSKGREIVVFDEDVYTGNTMFRFRDFLKNKTSVDKAVTFRANYKDRQYSQRLKYISGDNHWE